MPDREPQDTTNLDRYGSPPLPWSRVHHQLVASALGSDTPVFLSTASRNGRPHAAGVGAVWFDGDFYFTSGPATRKSRDLAVRPECALALRLNGIDVVFEGAALRVTDPSTLEQLAEVYRQGGWPAQVDHDALTAPYSAPSAGPPPWYLYRLTLHSAVGVATAEPNGASRWRFAP
jgi:Pyridoxamine 5'-phosphate oxidase